jgi:hypothetical protein
VAREDLHVIADLLHAILVLTTPDRPLSQTDLDLRTHCYDLAAERFEAHGFDPSRRTNDIVIELLIEAHPEDADVYRRLRDYLVSHRPS